MVADVEDFLPAEAETFLDEGSVSTDVDGAFFERAVLVFAEPPVLALDAEGRHLHREEVRLARAHDREIEEVLPRHGARQEVVEGVLEHRAGVVPLRVRNQEKLFAGPFLVEKGEGHLRVEVDEAAGVADDVLLQASFHVGGIERLLHLVPQVAVAHRSPQLAGVEEVDELHVHAGRRDREQRVEEGPAVVGQVDERPLIRFPLLVEAERLRPVKGPFHVAEAVGLHDVAVLGVDDEAADDQLRVELQVRHRPPLRRQSFLDERVRALLPLAHVVVDERIVHVVPDGANAPEVEGPVAKETAGGIGSFHANGGCVRKSNGQRWSVRRGAGIVWLGTRGRGEAGNRRSGETGRRGTGERGNWGVGELGSRGTGGTISGWGLHGRAQRWESAFGQPRPLFLSFSLWRRDAGARAPLSRGQRIPERIPVGGDLPLLRAQQSIVRAPQPTNRFCLRRAGCRFRLAACRRAGRMTDGPCLMNYDHHP